MGGRTTGPAILCGGEPPIMPSPVRGVVVPPSAAVGRRPHPWDRIVVDDDVSDGDFDALRDVVSLSLDSMTKLLREDVRGLSHKLADLAGRLDGMEGRKGSAVAVARARSRVRGGDEGCRKKKRGGAIAAR